MDRDNERIMSRGDLDRAARDQAVRIAPGDHQVAAPLQRDQSENDFGCGQAACRKVTQLAVKPGPSAVNRERGGRPASRACSSTNNTVGADMLPQSAITCRSWSSVP